MSDLFDFRARGNRFAVLGNPVAHSLSPRIHQLFARQFGLDIAYRRIQVDAGGFAQAVSHFGARGGAGLNITVPFKVEAWRLCAAQPGPGNRASARAAQAQAVNTVRFERGQKLFGDNTDGAGLARDLETNLGWAIGGRRVLLVGAGGAARGITGALLEASPRRLTIANRTPSKAQELASRLRAGDGGGDGDGDITGCSLARIDGAFDVIINATSAGLGGEAPALDPAIIGKNCLAYDLLYADAPTAFMRWAEAHGASAVSDGLGMLVEQAAESFYLWHARRPETGPVLDALRGAKK